MAKRNPLRRLIEQGREPGIELGIELGKRIGRVEGAREALLICLRAKFGRVTDEVTRRVETLEDLERLEALTVRVLTATSIEEMGL